MNLDFRDELAKKKAARLRRTPQRAHTFDENIGRKIGNMQLAKGKQGNIHIYMWDVIPPCNPIDCPAIDSCKFEDRKENGGKCQVQLQYLKHVFRIMSLKIEQFERDTRKQEIMAHRLGFMLMPLYSQLVKFKIEELGLRRVTYVTSKGEIKVHPIYKEIRAIMGAIDGVWKSHAAAMGVLWAGSPSEDTAFDSTQHGDPSYYHRISHGNEVRMEQVHDPYAPIESDEDEAVIPQESYTGDPEDYVDEPEAPIQTEIAFEETRSRIRKRVKV